VDAKPPSSPNPQIAKESCKATNQESRKRLGISGFGYLLASLAICYGLGRLWSFSGLASAIDAVKALP
jgi:hypothetical protein